MYISKTKFTKTTYTKYCKNFIMYYNNERLQEKIQELAPNEFRKQTLASVFFLFWSVLTLRVIVI